MARTLYDIFEVGANATPDEIRAAYRRMVQRHHPDKNPGQASSEELIKAINYAYGVLSDPHKRASYDTRLATGGTGPENGAGNVYVYTGEATINGAASSHSSRPSETRSARLSQISHVNSWLALGMLFLLFLAVSQFFYQVAVYGASTTISGSDSQALLYGIMIGVIAAGGVVWLVGKMVAYVLPLAWPMNLIFRERVRSDLDPEHGKIASAVLVAGIFLTFAVPDLDRRVELALNPSSASSVAAQAEIPVPPAQSAHQPAPVLPGTTLSVPSPSARAQATPPALPSGTIQWEKAPAPAMKNPVEPMAVTAAVPARPVAPPPSAQPAAVEQKAVMSTRIIAQVPVIAMPVPAKPAPAPAVKKPSEPMTGAVTPTVSRPAVEQKDIISPAPPARAMTPAPAKPATSARPPEKPVVKKADAPSELVPARVKTVSPAVAPPQVEEKVVRVTPPSVASPVVPLVRSVLEQKAPDIQPAAAASREQKKEPVSADAQYQLGRAYEKGEGVARDYTQARAWYSKAADQGHGPAQYSLGSMYMLGKGVAMDPVVAYVWLSLAVNNKVAAAQQVVDYLTDTLAPDQLADARRTVARWSPPRKR